MKGVAAAAIESVEAARAAGAEERVRADIASVIGEPLLERLLSDRGRTPRGGWTRCSAAAAYLEELGVTPRVAGAASEWLEQLRDEPPAPDARRDGRRRRSGSSGSSGPSADLDGLRTVYAAWCRRVPFDNVQKLIHLADGRPGPLPGSTAESFFEAWLDDGTGGTCWSGNGALHDLLARSASTSSASIATMLSSPRATEPNHGSVVATVDGERWLVDASILSGSPIRVPEPGAPGRRPAPALRVARRPPRRPLADGERAGRVPLPDRADRRRPGRVGRAPPADGGLRARSTTG